MLGTGLYATDPDAVELEHSDGQSSDSCDNSDDSELDDADAHHRRQRAPVRRSHQLLPDARARALSNTSQASSFRSSLQVDSLTRSSLRSSSLGDVRLDADEDRSRSFTGLGPEKPTRTSPSSTVA